MIVVAIITVLSGVGFIAVQRHQKSLTQLERNTIAKEIFVAAQNHLTMAERQGYLGVDSSALGNADGTDTHYFQYNTDTYGNNKLLDQMLPFGAIDEFVRVGTNSRYVIRYTLNPSATVLDVWYWSADTKQRGGELAYSDVSDQREVNGFREPNGVIVGWYGGDVEALQIAEDLISPSIEVINAERLTVELNTKYGSVDSTANVKLIVTGVSSGASAAIPVLINGSAPSGESPRVVRETGTDDTYVVTLDDITVTGMHFADLNSTEEYSAEKDAAIARSGQFYPGENIVIKAVAYDNSRLTNIAYSNEWTTNSLFADVVEDAASAEAEDSKTERIAKIGNIRHLENLDEAISGFASTNEQVKIDKAVQIANLVWKDAVPLAEGEESTAFLTRIDNNEAQVYKLGKTSSGEGNFQPVNPSDYNLVYEGFDPEADTVPHSITGIVVNADDAGLFGAPEKPLAVSNLELIDFDITGSGDAGALAGKLVDGSSVTNVLAHNSSAFEAEKNKAATIISTDADGSAGGLIGSMEGTTVSKCAAALVVSGSDAGGLVGRSDEGSVIGCYAGGHAVEKKDGDNVIGVWYGDVNEAGNAYNVTATGKAGGLIGDAGSTDISYSYSTCSVKGATAGGFVGNATGAVKYCYATGLVSGTTRGAFAGVTSLTATKCQYFEIVNEVADETLGFDYLTPLVKEGTNDGTSTNITAIDASADSYNSFVGADWKAAKVYLGKTTTDDTTDDWLDIYYGSGKFSLQTVAQLRKNKNNNDSGISLNVVETPDDSNPVADFVATHYGDWPAPEIFVINEKSGS